jgi:2-polyprenyl-3-methyl-5-hydroxy-6-metoxy-1,4-benzoquinol methylase
MTKDQGLSARAERERVFFDTLAEAEGDHWRGNRTRAGQLRQDIRAEMAIQFADVTAGKEVLKVGCASGDFSRRFANTGAEIIAIDVSPKLIALANSRTQTRNVKYQVANAETLELADNALDAVIGNAILHHLNLEKVLPEFKRVLKKGGKLCFAEPNMANPQVWLGHHVRFIGKQMQISPDETAFYRRSLEKKLSEMGFVNVQVRPFDFLHPSTPDALIPAVRRFGEWLEQTWLGEIAGSLWVVAEK